MLSGGGLDVVLLVLSANDMAYFPDLYSFPPSLPSLGCEVVVSKYCSIVTVQWWAQCPHLQAVLQCWHRGIRWVMSIATNSSVISFFTGPVDGWHSRDFIEPDLAARQEVAVLSPIVSREEYFVFVGFLFLYIYIYFFFASVYAFKRDQLRGTLMPSLDFFLSPITPPRLLKREFCLTLISCGEACKKLIRKSKRGGSSSICNIISTLLCECLGNKQSVGRISVQRWI